MWDSSKTPFAWLDKTIGLWLMIGWIICSQPIMRAEYFAEISHDNKYKNWTLQLRKYMSMKSFSHIDLTTKLNILPICFVSLTGFGDMDDRNFIVLVGAASHKAYWSGRLCVRYHVLTTCSVWLVKLSYWHKSVYIKMFKESFLAIYQSVPTHSVSKYWSIKSVITRHTHFLFPRICFGNFWHRPKKLYQAIS